MFTEGTENVILYFRSNETFDVRQVAEAAELAIPTGRVYDSVSLLPLLTGADNRAPRNESFFYSGATLQVMFVL